MIFLWTTKPKDFVIALIKLGLPYRYGFAIMVALRFLPLMQDEVRKVREAHLVRKFRPTPGIRGLYRRLTRYLMPLLTNALRKSETAAMAMESRAFGLYRQRTYTNEFRWSASGLALLAVVLMLVAASAYLGGFEFVQPRYH